MRAIPIACVFAIATPVAADVEDPVALFSTGRYAAAAAGFERRWESRGNTVDGVNAAASWRTAGRYARAAALLARIRSTTALDGEPARLAGILEERLAVLTATATIDGPVAPDALIRVDDDVAERIGDVLVLDIGEHDIVIEQDTCKPFVWHGTAYPGARIVVPFKPVCEQRGTLHLDLDPGTAYTLDGKPHRATTRETTIKLDPGMHQLRVDSRARPVLSETVTIRSHETTSVRPKFPWRARARNWILGVTGTARAGSSMSGLGLAATAGVWGSRFRATVDFGSVMSTLDFLGPPGHPWFGATAAIHVTTRPLWNGRIGPYRVALDLDPIATRFDQVRATSYFGIRGGGDTEIRATSLSFLPISLSADGPWVHLEIALWPISIVRYEGTVFPDDIEAPVTVIDERGFGAFLTILGGWRL